MTDIASTLAARLETQSAKIACLQGPAGVPIDQAHSRAQRCRISLMLDEFEARSNHQYATLGRADLEDYYPAIVGALHMNDNAESPIADIANVIQGSA